MQGSVVRPQVPSILVDETTVHKISHLTPNIGVVYSGMGPDSRVGRAAANAGLKHTTHLQGLLRFLRPDACT